MTVKYLQSKKSKSCGKFRFATKVAAEKKLIRLQDMGRLVTRAYFCPICGFYHLTSQELR